MLKNYSKIFAVAAACFAVSANAVPVLSFAPSSQTVNVGDTLSVSAVLSGLQSGGLDEALTAFDVQIGFDSSILGINGVTFNPAAELGGAADTFFDSSLNTSSVSFNLTSFLSDALLQSLESDSITLGELSFTALAEGFSALSYTWQDLTGLNSAALDHSTVNGSVTVAGRTAPVPEPSSILLLGIGMLGVLGFNRHKLMR